jgi:hypothetical protein
MELFFRRGLVLHSESEDSMDNYLTLPQVFHVLDGQALEVQPSPYGAVGTLFHGEGLEAVWVCYVARRGGC